MKIDKIQNLTNLQINDPSGMFSPSTIHFSKNLDFTPTISVQKLSDNLIYVSDSEGNTHTITLDSNDILKLMTWYIGQEKHTQEELTSLRKKVEAQENQKPLVGIEAVYEEVREKNKENQKIVKGLIEIAKTGNSTWTRGMISPPTYERLSIKLFLETITGKDIKDL